MDDRRTLILKTALKLFNEKGYHETSMQSIADAAGIAKGSTYLYFRSKEELLVSVIHYFYEGLLDESERLASDETLTPKERLLAVIQRQFAFGLEHGPFLLTQLEDALLPNNTEAKQVFVQIWSRKLGLYRDLIVGMYGEAAKPHALDCAFVLQAVTREFTAFMVVGNQPLDPGQTAALLVGMLDQIQSGFANDNLIPVLTGRILIDAMRTGMPDGLSIDKMVAEIEQLQHRIEPSRIDRNKWNELAAALQVLIEELKKPSPIPVVLKGMLSYIEKLNVTLPELDRVLLRLQAMISKWE